MMSSRRGVNFRFGWINRRAGHVVGVSSMKFISRES
jgi:hypothetical protein